MGVKVSVSVPQTSLKVSWHQIHFSSREMSLESSSRRNAEELMHAFLNSYQ